MNDKTCGSVYGGGGEDREDPENGEGGEGGDGGEDVGGGEVGWSAA